MSKASKPWAPEKCPITQRPFFMWIEHHKTGEMVPTYGGPYDSYTLAEFDGEDFVCERFDHDAGGWLVDCVEGLGVKLVDDQSLVINPNNTRYDELETFAAASIAAPVSAEPVAVPKGWRLVPVSPTKEMLLAGETDEYNTAIWWDLMLAAAPAAPVADQAQPSTGIPSTASRIMDLGKQVNGIRISLAGWLDKMEKTNWEKINGSCGPDDITLRDLNYIACRLRDISNEVQASPQGPCLNPHMEFGPLAQAWQWGFDGVTDGLVSSLPFDIFDAAYKEGKKAKELQAQQPVSGADGLIALEGRLLEVAETVIKEWQGQDRIPPMAWDFRGFLVDGMRAALAQQASRPEAVPGNSEILDLAISEGMTAKDGVYCGSAATILCFAGALTRGAALAQQDADKVDAERWRAYRAAIAAEDSAFLGRGESYLSSLGLRAEVLPTEGQIDAAIDAARKEPGQ